MRSRTAEKSEGRVALKPREVVKGKGKGKKGGPPPSLISRGPVEDECAAPWRHEFCVEALQKEMANRAAQWGQGKSVAGPDRQE